MSASELAIPDTAEGECKTKVYAKLLKVLGALGWVEKRGENTLQKYKYVMADDVADAVRKVLVQHGVAITADVYNTEVREVVTKDNKTLRITRVDVLWTFADVESGEAVSVSCPGEAMDSGDKAIYKAMTGSLKYAMKMNFLLPTGDDPEEESEHDREVSSSPGQAPGAKAQPKRQSAGTPSSAAAASASRPVQKAAAKKFTLKFGKYKGKTLDDPEVDDSYLEWLHTQAEEKVAAKDEKYHDANVAMLKAIEDEMAARMAPTDGVAEAKEILEGETKAEEEIPF